MDEQMDQLVCEFLNYLENREVKLLAWGVVDGGLVIAAVTLANVLQVSHVSASAAKRDTRILGNGSPLSQDTIRAKFTARAVSTC